VSANGRSYDLVLFDLDGTLTDPKPGITRCVRHALAHFGIAVDDPDALTPFIGPPLADSFARFYGFDAEQSHWAIEKYRERFATIGLFENAVYPGIPEALRALTATGASLAIASSKPTVFVERIVHHFEIGEHFSLLAGSNLDRTRVAKEEVIAHVLATLPGFDPLRTIMVGDREHDVHGARANDLSTIAVSYGYGTREELETARPVAIVDSVAELSAILSGAVRPGSM
jgi:phosphoglycolate phosphatase